METKDAILSAMKFSDDVLMAYLSDLSDDDLSTRPNQGCNHLAAQLGHLISSETQLIELLCPGKGLELPNGFVEQHSEDSSDNDEASEFCSKDEYLSLYSRVREATRAALRDFPTNDFEQPSPDQFRERFPTIGDLFILIAQHPLMHAGQFAVTRRVLGKPVLI